MIFIKKAGALFTAVFLLLPLFCLMPSAEGEEKFTFIDGENVVRQTNTAVLYQGSESVTLNSRGHDIIVGADGGVTKIYEGTIGADREIEIPEGGCVVSASGSAVSWLKANVKVGSKVRYDRYTQRLFLCNELGEADPYFSKQIAVNGENGSYTVANESESVSRYSYDVAVDANGVIVARGSGISAGDGGFIVSATTEADRNTLIMYAIVGGTCVVLDGIATFSYDNTMLLKTMEIAVADAKAEIEKAKSAFADIDISKADGIIQHAESILVNSTETDYFAVSAFAERLEKEIDDVCSEDEISELRAAFHTPYEVNADEVRQTVLKAKYSGLNTIILRTTNSVGTCVSLPDSFPFEQDEAFESFDVLKSFIDICDEENIALTLCIDVYYNKYAAIANESWLAENDDITIEIEDVEIPEYETIFEGKYFSPASEDFKTYFLSYVKYIVTHYDIDSIMFDYLRYPKFSELTDIGYDDETMTRFSREVKQPISECYKIRALLFDSPLWQDWVKFRTGLIDDMAKSISETVRNARGDINITAVAERESVDYYYMQNAVGWIENGWMDGLCLELYDSNSEENDDIPELAYHDDMISEKCEIFSAYTADDAYLFAGLDAEKSYSSETLTEAVKDLRSNGSDGFIFSNLYSYIEQNYYDSLSYNVMRNNSISPFADTATSMKSILEYSKEKLSRAVSNGWCDETTANSVISQLDARIALLGEEALSYEQAVALESDIAMLLASCGAKSELLEELESLTKLAYLSRDGIEAVTPPDDFDESEPDPIPEPDDEQGEPSEVESIPDAPIYSEPAVDNEGIDIGSILIYVFIGGAMIAAIVGMIFAARKKETKPVNRHMTKRDADKNGDKTED